MLRNIAHFKTELREVVQLGRIFGLGPRGRRFESCPPDIKQSEMIAFVF